MNDLLHKSITGRTAVKIASDIERMIRDGALAAGDRLPAVRDLAGRLMVSPATVASAYQLMQARAILVANGRRGTRVSHRPMAGTRRRQAIPSKSIDLSDGNPDPALLPPFRQILHSLEYSPRLYGTDPMHAGLISAMQREMEHDGIKAGHWAVVSGSMDGLDRLFTEHLRPGDRIAVEDPGFTGHHDLIASRGLALAPVRVDDEGMLPDSLERAYAEGVQAVLITPRAQSPTGAAFTEERARQLRTLLRRRPDVLVIEDDHASFTCSAPYQRVHHPEGRWAHLRSFSKSFNPDLRLAIMTGDDETMTRLIDRLIVVERWVSHVLQSAAHALLMDKSARAHVRKAGQIYDERRESLIQSLRTIGLSPMGQSGYNVWLPVDEETPVVQALGVAGWAVAAGERFRLGSPPGIRITASRLHGKDVHGLTSELARIMSVSHRRPLA